MNSIETLARKRADDHLTFQSRHMNFTQGFMDCHSELVTSLVEALEKIQKAIVDGTESALPTSRLVTKIDFMLMDAMMNYNNKLKG